MSAKVLLLCWKVLSLKLMLFESTLYLNSSFWLRAYKHNAMFSRVNNQGNWNKNYERIENPPNVKFPIKLVYIFCKVVCRHSDSPVSYEQIHKTVLLILTSNPELFLHFQYISTVVSIGICLSHFVRVRTMEYVSMG